MTRESIYNDFVTELKNREYDFIQPKSWGDKPTFIKGDNKVIICMGCGWVKINNKTIRFHTIKMQESIKNIISQF